MLIATTILGALMIGISLGLFGSGGSILTVPVLLYLLGHEAKVAVAESLAIVGGVAFATVFPYITRRQVSLRLALGFGLPGMVGTYGGAALAGLVPDVVQIATFCAVMLWAAFSLDRRTRRESGSDAALPAGPGASPTRIIFDGLAVGTLTGFVGVGGGFLVVPALVILGGLPIRTAVGTSLLVIAMKSAAGFWKYLDVLDSLELAVDLTTIVTFIGIGIVGSMLGQRLNSGLDPRKLARAFALFLVVMTLFILGKETLSRVVGTASAQDGSPPTSPSVAESEPSAPDSLSSLAHLPLPSAQALLDGCFTTSGACAMCHESSPDATAMRDSHGRSIAPYDLWQSTMMANSARDPLWRAMVSTEVAATPSRKSEIERKCLQCHAPMAAVEATHQERELGLDELYDSEKRLNQLALDGVSCSLCHQITSENFGDPKSFSGGFTINSEKHIYGPHDDVFPMPMIRHTGFTPTHGAHIEQSELCATCHTLETHGYEADGTSTGIAFLEQAPYLEWKASAYARGEQPRTCQSCHVPRVDPDGVPYETTLAHNPGGFDFPFLEPRTPYGLHVFVGGNTLIPAILRDHRETLQPLASDGAFDATIALAKAQLETKTVRASLQDVVREGDALRFAVRLQNLTGHKFPTAHPTRRAWLHVRVTGEDGTVHFESGRYDAAGRLLDARGEVHPTDRRGGPHLPHYAEVDSADEVQIYEGVMSDSRGEWTHTLMRATGWWKDNRLLPWGWLGSEETRPHGVDDADFGPGIDDTRYRVTAPESAPLVIEVEVLYQTLGARSAAELLGWDTPEVREFRHYYESADRTPIRIATLRREVPAR